jgi:hypothetical protein
MRVFVAFINFLFVFLFFVFFVFCFFVFSCLIRTAREDPRRVETDVAVEGFDQPLRRLSLLIVIRNVCAQHPNVVLLMGAYVEHRLFLSVRMSS